jgi:hypothetical protein
LSSRIWPGRSRSRWIISSRRFRLRAHKLRLAVRVPSKSA